MKVLSKQEYNLAIESGHLELYMYDIVRATHDIEHNYYKIKCVGNEVHLIPCEIEVKKLENKND